ncbi:MAG: HAMP domain-containing histidine kinase [Kordiimonadaceae bacterium]|nr:HAMP domain-containing histidine kinase [Kordiimonadaceae bacterium]
MDGTVQDVTKSWHKENELRLATEQAILANRTKSQFLSTMSHELRTPLNAIIGMSSLIEDETLGPLNEYDYKSYITDIKNSGHVLLNHINNMLDITDVELDIVDINLERANSKELIESCVDLVSGSSVNHNVQFQVNISDSLDELETDTVLFRKILHNILSNAAKFSHYGGKVIVSLKKDESEKNILLSVEDLGIGIAEDELETIFEPFTQVDMEFTRKYDGAGLGLSVVKRFTEALGGNVDLISKVNSGTTVNVCLPISG